MKESYINKKTVLITSPSINPKLNIGGISSLTKLLIENNSSVGYLHFVRGKKDKEKKGLSWIFNQPNLLLQYFMIIHGNKDLNIVHINMPLEKNAIIRDSFLIIIAALNKKKVVVHLHGGNYSLKFNIPAIFKLLIKISIYYAKTLIVLGQNEKDFLINHYKVQPQKIIVLPNAVNIPEFTTKEVQNPINILFMGRIEKNKGLKEIISALELLKESQSFRFKIAGDGPDKVEFIDECKRKIPNHFDYLGVVSGVEKENILLCSHIFILPSYYEGLPYALLEAMANKLVPIVTPVGVIPEIIIDNQNGYIVPIHDFQSIYRKLLEIIEDKSIITCLGENAYHTAKSNFSLKNYINKFNYVYENILYSV